MGREDEIFRRDFEFNSLNRPDAAKELGNDIRRMGEPEDLIRDAERREEENFVNEQRDSDDAALHDFFDTEREVFHIEVAMKDMEDLIEKCGVRDYVSLGSLLGDLEDSSKVVELTQGAQTASKFYQRPEQVKRFVAGIGKLLESGIIASGMTLTKALSVLDQELETNKEALDRARELKDRDTDRTRLAQLTEFCRILDTGMKDSIKKMSAERFTASRSQEGKDEDWLAVNNGSKTSAHGGASCRGIRQDSQGGNPEGGKAYFLHGPV